VQEALGDAYFFSLFSSIFLSAPLRTGNLKNDFVERLVLGAVSSVRQH
jgi:hypothetical protein